MEETNGIINQLGALSYFGIFGVSLLANMVIPIPEEIILLAFGYLVGTGHLSAWLLIPILIAGLLISDIVIYWLAKKGNKLIVGIYNKFFSKRLPLDTSWLYLHINKVIFFSRFLMQLRFLGPFLAGQQNVPMKRFVKINFLALLIYVPLYIFIGMYFHSRIGRIIDGIGLVKNILLVAIGVVVVISISKFFNSIIFGPYTLALHGKPEERTIIPFIYKVKK